MIILDTCAIIWDALEPSKLSSKAKGAIKRSGNELLICDISIWEISLLIKRKRLLIDENTSDFINLVLQSRSFQVQGITPEIAELSVNFGPEVNNDPVDRLIAATSIVMNAPVITADKNLRDAPVIDVIW